MLIDNPNKSYYIKLGGAITTNELTWIVTYLDTTRLSSLDGETSGATPVTMVDGLDTFQQPPVNANKLIQKIAIQNTDTVPQIVYVYLNNNSSIRNEVKVLLGVGYSLQYEYHEGWYTLDDNGARINIEISLSGIAIGDTVVGGVANSILYVNSSLELQQLANGLSGVMSLGGETGGHNLVITDADLITSQDGLTYMDFGNGSSWSVNTGSYAGVAIADTGAGISSQEGGYYVMDSTVITPLGNIVLINPNNVRIIHDTKISFESPIYHFDNLTLSTVPYLDASKNLVSSVVTPTELGYVSGVTSSIQTQINNINSGLSWKVSVRVATTANITLSGTQTIDGVAVIAGDRVLVKNQTSGPENGIYVCSAGAWSRSTDASTGGGGSTGILQATMSVQEGTVSADFIYTCSTNAPITIGVTSLTFVKTSATTYTADELSITLSANQFALKVMTSATFAGFISDETGSGALVFANTPTLVTPVLGVATATSINGLTITSSTGTLTISNGKTLTVSDSTTLATNSITFAGTEVLTLAATKSVTFADAFITSGAFSLTLTTTAATNVTFPTTGTLATLAGTEVFTNKTLTSPLISNSVGSVAGSIEYDTVVFYSTPVTGARGVSPSIMYSIIPAGGFTLSTSTGVQSAFPTTGDVWTLQGTTTYEVEWVFTVGKSGTTCTVAVAFALGGGASVTSITLKVFAGPGTTSQSNVGTVASTVINTTTTTNQTFFIKGIIRMNAGGTVTPQIDFSASPSSPSMGQGSYIKFTPIGTNTNDIMGAVG